MIVVFTVGGRDEYLRQSLATWAKVRGIRDAGVLFCVEPGEAKALEVIHTWDRMVMPAGKVIVSVNETRCGVLGNPHHAMESAFRIAGTREHVVLAEEDVTVSDDILEYFAWALAELEHDRRVRFVCANHWDQPSGGANDIERYWDLFLPLNWGTWRDRWENEIRDRWDFDYSHDGWDKRCSKLLAEEGKCVVRPCRSRTQHIGQFGGAHCSPWDFAQTQAREWTQHYEPGSWAVTRDEGLLRPGRRAD